MNPPHLFAHQLVSGQTTGQQIGIGRWRVQHIRFVNVRMTGHGLGEGGLALGNHLDDVHRFVDHRVRAVPMFGGVCRDIVGIEQVRLAAAGARHPLPTQVVAGDVAIQQMAVHPLGTNTPMHFAQVHQITGQPQAGMVVDIAVEIQLPNGLVDSWHARGSQAHILGQALAVGLIRQDTIVKIVAYVVAQQFMNMLEILAPSQLENELVLHPHAVHLVNMVGHIGHGQQAVCEVGRQHADRPLNVVAGLRVFKRSNGRQSGLHRMGIGLKQGLFDEELHGARRFKGLPVVQSRHPKTWLARQSLFDR